MRDDLRRRPPIDTEAFRAGYSDVVHTARSLGLVVELIPEGPACFWIRLSVAGGPELRLTDYWDSLPLMRSEQVGWMLSINGGPVLAQCEEPATNVALQIIESAMRNQSLRHSAA